MPEWRDTLRMISSQRILDWLRDMDQIVEFFEYRDKMNAAIHTTEVQYSPITELARACRMTIASLPEAKDA